MNTSTDPKAALALVHGLENGGVDTDALRRSAEDLDPVLLAAILRYLRAVYPASQPAASAVLERVVALTDAWPGLIELCQEGERDPVWQWFTSEHTLGSFRGRSEALIEILVDKLES
jgi:hypothetical protein